MSINTPSFIASETIPANRFVRHSTTADFTVDLAGANEYVIGATPTMSRAHDDANHALAGDPVAVIGHGQVAEILVGSGGVSRGVECVSDASGQAVEMAGADLQNAAGIPMEDAVEGELARIFLISRQVDNS